jgi:UDP:flavonoid glycosyltransferase YjiC (YdhE family)
MMGRAERVLVCADPLLDPAGSRNGASSPNGQGSAVWSGAVVDDVVPALDSAAGAEPPAANGRPRVLASLSTTAFPGQQKVLQRILDAAAGLPVELVMTTGPAVDPAQLWAPANATLHRFVDHNRIMPGCSAVIGHGGHATTMRALAHGLPVMVLPMHPMLDQRMVGKAISDAGAGVLLSRTSSPDRIGAALTALLESESHRDAAALVGARLRQAAGAKAGAQVLTDLADHAAGRGSR